MMMGKENCNSLNSVPIAIFPPILLYSFSPSQSTTTPNPTPCWAGVTYNISLGTLQPREARFREHSTQQTPPPATPQQPPQA